MNFSDFDKAFDNLSGMMDGAVSGMMAEAMKNEKRPSVTALNFVPLPAAKAEPIRNAKSKLFGGKAKKLLISSIEQGRTKYVEVLALARRHVDIDSEPGEEYRNIVNRRYKYFYKIANLQGVVLREDVPMIDDPYCISFTYDSRNSGSETGCKDIVNPADYRHLFLLNYYLKDDCNYVLVTKEQLNDLSPLVKYAGVRYHFCMDGCGYKW